MKTFDQFVESITGVPSWVIDYQKMDDSIEVMRRRLSRFMNDNGDDERLRKTFNEFGIAWQNYRTNNTASR